MFSTSRKIGVLGAGIAAGVVLAATQITINPPFALSDGASGDKPKIQRAGDGTLVVVYGDNPDGAGVVYDVKANAERLARDVFVKTCKPDATKSCDSQADWSAPVNLSGSALQMSSGVFDWRGTLGEPASYPGDIDKANIKTSGPVMVITWVSKHCPDGDLATAGLQPAVQRGVRYMERDGGRVIPFSCMWVAWSTNNGTSWKPAVQLSTGVRDAIQDASNGGFNSDTRKGQINFSWQEDPVGLKLGEADGPGDGASGANVSMGTDIWYTSATVDLSDNSAVPPVSSNDFVLATPVRLTDNHLRDGIDVTTDTNAVFEGNATEVSPTTIESGDAGASRANIGMLGNQALVAYEETKAAGGASSGKFIRYHSFTFNKPTPIGGDAASNDPKGCVISDPLRNARRVRFLTQSPADAGAGGVQLAVFWKEGLADKGGSSDIVLRRAIGPDATTVSVKPANMQPVVDAACATSVYVEAVGLTSARGTNISSRSTVATAADNGLADDTERNNTENALAHRGVLRGRDLWVGYSYTRDLALLDAQMDNYNFWIRQFNVDTGAWSLPSNVTRIADTHINVREPRIFGTPKSNPGTCPSGNPADPLTTDKTQCQNTDVVYLAWGTQENVPLSDPEGGDDLGVYITQSSDAGQSFATPVRYSTAKGSLFQDDESAFEAQIVTRPDGTRFYGVWNQADAISSKTVAEYASGEVAIVADPPAPPTPAPVDEGGGCTAATGQRPIDPALPVLALFALFGLGLRRVRTRSIRGR
ncbi:choice-of-anchor O protein [Hydrogenophaga sp.]|uniref:choice-of-anchor O protein n=1 Tax=Hydrogenophaga sp. TaxID=1904254 RepID=UPI002FC66B09